MLGRAARRIQGRLCQASNSVYTFMRAVVQVGSSSGVRRSAPGREGTESRTRTVRKGCGFGFGKKGPGV